MSERLVQSATASASTSTSTSTSTSAMDDCSIPFPFPQQDIFLEILFKLDPKSLTSLKVASKSWYNFLSNPSFSKLYFKSRPSITSFFYRTSPSYPEKINYMALHPNQQPITDPTSCLGFLDNPALIFNSCNGLLHWRTSMSNHIISNPLNNKFVPVNWPFLKSEVFASGIAFDPSVSDDFEVVVLLIMSPTRLKSKSFSSVKLEWGLEKELSVTVNDTTINPCCPNRGVFINGALYWELKNNSLFEYNVKDGIDRFIELPMNPNSTKRLKFSGPGCLGESKGKLQFCRILGTLLLVWEQRLGNSATWYPLHTIELSGKIPSIKPNSNQVLAFLDDCKGALLSTKNEIKAYYFEDGLVKEVCQVPMPCLQPSMFFPFVHTLALSSFQSV